MPVLGSLFSSKSYQRETNGDYRHPLSGQACRSSKKLIEPIDGTQPPSNADYFLSNTEEVKASDGNGALALADGGVAQPAAVTTAGHFLDLPKD